MRMASGDFDFIFSAISSVSCLSLSADTTLLTRPKRKAVSASIKSPVSNISMACLRCILRLSGTAGVEQNSPTLIPDTANRAVSDATARSQAATS